MTEDVPWGARQQQASEVPPVRRLLQGGATRPRRREGEMGVDSGTGVAPGWRPPTLAPAGAASNHSHLLPPCASSGSTGFRVQDAQLLLQATKNPGLSNSASLSLPLCCTRAHTHAHTHVRTGTHAPTTQCRRTPNQSKKISICAALTKKQP